MTRSKLAALAVSVAAAALVSPATAQDKAQHSGDLGRRRRPVEHQRLHPRHDGYRTPNIDRIADEGMLFTDYYGEQSCTAGRSSFITGQSVFRTGLSKVGLPGAELGLRIEDPTIAGLLKPHGYATGQFGKNHLGDRRRAPADEPRLRRVLGNLYHLNAEEEPEHEDYPDPKEYPSSTRSSARAA